MAGNDITELKLAEERLRQAQKMEAVGQLIGGIDHDFNNLLAVITGNAELMSDSAEEDSKKIKTILRAGARGAELTRRLLAFSRQQSLSPQAINLQELVDGMFDLLSRTLGATVQIETSSPPELWMAMADPGQVENTLLNLAINARDAMPQGGHLTIDCSNIRLDNAYRGRNPEALAGDYVALRVIDTGFGMPLEVQARAFDPFFTTKDVGQGSGLGLSMIYGFAKQSGGQVTIDSTDGSGTAITLYLPRAATATDSKRAPETSDVPRGGGETILVIEDDDDVRELAIATLDGLGYRVVSAIDAKDARTALAKNTNVDLILSDVILPGGLSSPLTKSVMADSI